MDVQAQVHASSQVSCGMGPSMAEQSDSDKMAFNSGSLDSAALTSSVGLRVRKNKPPNLQLSPRSERLLRHNTDHSPNSVEATAVGSVTPQTPNPSVIMRNRTAGEVGLNSPIVKRSSRLEQILEIPDVKAALVKDAGYEMIRHRSREKSSKSCQGRQQTPGRQENDEHFSFDHSSGDSESASESDVSPHQSGRDTQNIQPEKDKIAEADKPRKYRSYMAESSEHSKQDPNPYHRIADSTGPALLFGSSIEVGATSPTLPTTPPSKRKGFSKTFSEGDGDVTKSRALLSRLKFSSLSRSGSSSNIEGWDSLARALARVGSATSLIASEMDTFDLNPKLSPILKRNPHAQRWSDTSISQEPGMKPTMHKKTVSFSRLPSESIVKNAADCVSRMHDGHQFVKMRSNSRVYNRLYWLDEGGSCLRWEPSKKDSGKARIDITQIREVRPGKTTELFLTSDISGHFPDECSFSIVHGEGKTLDLIANSADDANVWVTGLRCLVSGQDVEGLRMRRDGRDEWLSVMFEKADLNSDGFLDEEESFKLFTSLSDGIRDLRIKQKLQEYLKLKEKDRARLAKDEFIEIFKDVATRPEVYFLLARYATADDQLSLDDLMNFLQSEQGLSQVTKDNCLEIIDIYEPSEAMKSIPALGIDGFTKYLTSDNCAIFNPKHLKVCQDMGQPLSHYFIASSHNTYLMEDQISGPSNASAYVRALLRCCRCVELDCWDGSDGQPVVSHGYNRSNSIPFRQVIEAISDSAFRNSAYPVILSIENHCSEDQQRNMAETLRFVLGDKIYVGGLEGDYLPSPQTLIHRFLIRGKKLPPQCCDDVGYVTDDDEGQEVNSKMNTSPHSPSLGTSEPDVEGKHHSRALVRELSDLVSICITVTMMKDLKFHQKSYGCQHTSSVHEKTAAMLVEKFPEDFLIHNKKFLTRVYPSGVRVDSSNFNPQDYWNCGVQIASLNYQTPGLMMDINDGKFSMNGCCGYVLKPTIMRDPLAYYSSQMRDINPGLAPRTLYLRVISGQNFPKPRGGGAKGHVIDPYVLIELFGVPSDCAEQRTRTAPNNSGGSPIFDEAFEFRLSLPSLALVRFVVLDDDFIGDEFIGQYTIPFECLQPGYRHLRLRSIFDEPLENATLFVHIAITDSEITPRSSGGAASNQPINAVGRMGSKRSSTQKKMRKPRQRKESDSVQIIEVGHPDVDEIFRGAGELLQGAASLRESQRWSLSCFRDTCGVSALASIKQCIRALAQRSRSDATMVESMMTSRHKRKFSTPDQDEADVTIKTESRRRAASTDGGMTRLRRQTSDTSQSSNESSATAPIHIRLLRHDRKISLQLKGQSSSNESWRKTSLTLDALITDTLALINEATAYCNTLTSIYEKAAALYQDLPTLLANGSNLNCETEHFRGATNGSSTKRGSKSKKKQLPEVEGRKRQTSDENFRWNCSVIKGQRDSLMTSYHEAEDLLSAMWEAGMKYGLVDVQSSTDQELNGLESLQAKSSNQNANNNQESNVSKSPIPFIRSVSQLARPRSKSAPKLTERPPSSEPLDAPLL